MLWVHWILGGLGLFVVGNLVVSSCPAYQRWLRRVEERDAALLAEAKARFDAEIKAAILRCFWQCTDPSWRPPEDMPRENRSPLSRLDA